MRTVSIAVLAGFSLLWGAGAQAQPECTGWQSIPFAQLSGPNGANNPVEALCVWDPDGAGPLVQRLVAAGSFTSMQGVAANNIATRDPVTGKWQALGAGTNGTIRALVVFNGELIAAGFFSQAGGRRRTASRAGTARPGRRWARAGATTSTRSRSTTVN